LFYIPVRRRLAIKKMKKKEVSNSPYNYTLSFAAYRLREPLHHHGSLSEP